MTPRVDNDRNGRIGGDVKYGITQNITADLTVNTDFAQVEVDEQQVNLTRFNLFFPEKRDFFLEGLGTFAFAGRASAGLGAGTGDTPYLFFSRRIGLDQSRVIPIVAGGRATGKAGKFTFGAINVQTGDDDGGEDRGGELHGAARQARHPAPQQHRRHVHASHRDARAASAPTTATASTPRCRSIRTSASTPTSPRRSTEGREGDNLSYRGLFDYNADKYGVQVERLVVEPNFLPEIGFVRRTDMRRNFGLAALQPAADARCRHVRKLTTQASLNYLTNNQNRLDTREASGALRGGVHQQRSVQRHLHRQLRAAGAAVRDRDGRHAAGRRLRLPHHARRLHRRPAAPLLRRDRLRDRARSITAIASRSRSTRARLQVTPQVSLEPSLSINWVDLVQGSFTAKVARTRATYTITPRMFVSGIVQYNSAGTSFGSNVRFRWEYRPGSELFVVYTDDFNTEELRPDVTSLRNRAFVIKFNRLFRL